MLEKTAFLSVLSVEKAEFCAKLKTWILLILAVISFKVWFIEFY